MSFVEKIYSLTKDFPVEERFGLIAQLRRASVSVASNIAEGAARQTTKEKIQSYYIARGSLSEVDTQLEISHRLGLIDTEQRHAAIEDLDEVGRLLNGLIESKKGISLTHSLTSSLSH